ncbi:hypothetical protein SCHPADRAFT_898273 [Schizopora paradoxa]|uniref:FAM192A/Fyv6 N-terminal domain-containing protein n=1 Tax=Schizopora paradoxa TaxID=27342 RepID=A0A0H2SET7_9AGAM|nr:hypothetical protein SCHPADRAFT_898273 [Schizopora paradoxa]
MDDDALLAVSETSVGSRFISQKQLDSAKAARDAQWHAAYERLGEKPPPRQEPDVYDGRSLAEKLAANKAAKLEEREERAKLANQFRALEEDEVVFLDSMKADRDQAERKRKMEDDEEVEGFKAAIAARSALPDTPPVIVQTSTPGPSATKPKPTAAPAAKKKAGLKGVVVKKKKTESSNSKPKATATEQVEEGPQKKRKVSESSPSS